MFNGDDNKQILEKVQNENSSILSNSTNTSFNENIIQDINYYKTKEIFLISKNFEIKIPELLSFLQNELKYLESLFTKIDYNSEIFSYKYSNDKEKLNLFQIIINQYITTPNDKEDYLRELKGFFSLLVLQITLDKDTYHYIFSFIINYINKCNNFGYDKNIQSQENNYNLTSEQLSRILQLLQIYYQGMKTVDEPYNFFYFNGDSENPITILNKQNKKSNKKIFDLNETLNILLFIKLVPSQIIKQVYTIFNHKIFDIFFTDKTYNICKGIDKDNYLTTNFTYDKLIKIKEKKII